MRVIYRDEKGRYIVERWSDGKVVATSTYDLHLCIQIIMKAYSG